jgi:hypothetical protein
VNFYAYSPGDLLSRDRNLALVVDGGTVNTFTVQWVTGSNTGKRITYQYGERPTFKMMNPS